MTNAQPSTQGFWRKGSGWSEMLIRHGPGGGGHGRVEAQTQPARSPVKPTPAATDRPFSIWMRNTRQRGSAGEIFAIVMRRIAVYRSFCNPLLSQDMHATDLEPGKMGTPCFAKS